MQVIFIIDKQDSILSVTIHRKKQVDLYQQSAQSALEFQFNYYGIKAHYPTIQNTSQNDQQGYSVSSNAYGLWHQAELKSFWKNGIPPIDLHQQFSVFQIIDSLPSLILLDTTLELEIAKGTLLEGEIALKSGLVRPSSRYEIRYTGDSLKIQTRDSTWKNWKKWIWSTASAREWAHDLDSVNPTSSSIHISQNTYQDTLFKAKIIKISDSSHFENCILYAQKIFIQGRSTFKNCQIIAQDSLVINLKTPQNSTNFFWLNPSTKDTLIKPMMTVVNYEGRGQFIVADTNYAHKKNADHEGILFKSDSLNLVGSIFVYGEAQIHGKIEGLVIVKNLSTELNGTLWKGFVIDLQIKPLTKKLKVPLIFPALITPQSFFYEKLDHE